MAADVEHLLRRLGPSSWYGLRSVELVCAPGRLELGRYTPVGRIQLFDLPLSPWRIPLARETTDRLVRAGAVLVVDPRWGVEIRWPGDTLRRFVLFDVLLHELGHHRLQHHYGKRLARIARTRDHEAFAELTAERARRQLEVGE